MKEIIEYYKPGIYVKDTFNDIHIIKSIQIDIDSTGIAISYFTTENDAITPVAECTEQEYKEYLLLKENLKKEKIKDVCDVFNEVFNEDDWDYSFINDHECDFIIKYDNILIENKRKESHLIPQLFIRMRYDVEDKRFFDIRMIRGIQTMDEYRSMYVHSHASSGDGWREMCWGDGRMSNLRINIFMENFNLEDLKLFLLDLYPYLCWENVDFTCYSYINSLYKNTRTPPSSQDITHLDMNYIITNSDLTEFITFDDKLCSFNINQNIGFLEAVSKDAPESLKCYYDLELNAFGGTSSTPLSNSNPIPLDFSFKGNPVYKTFINSNLETDLSTMYRFLSPNNITRLKDYLSIKLLDTLKKEEINA